MSCAACRQGRREPPRAPQAARRGVEQDPACQRVLTGRDRQLRGEDAVRGPVAVLVDRGKPLGRRPTRDAGAPVGGGDRRVTRGPRVDLERAQLVLVGLVVAEAHESDDTAAPRPGQQLARAGGAQDLEAAVDLLAPGCEQAAWRSRRAAGFDAPARRDLRRLPCAVRGGGSPRGSSAARDRGRR